MLKLLLKHESHKKYGRTCFAPVDSKSHALFKLIKTDQLFPEDLPHLYKMGFHIDYIGNKSEPIEEVAPTISLYADLIYGKVKLKLLHACGESLAILIKRGYIEIYELSLLQKMGFQFSKITGNIKLAAKEIAALDIGFELTKEGELLYDRESKSEQSRK